MQRSTVYHIAKYCTLHRKFYAIDLLCNICKMKKNKRSQQNIFNKRIREICNNNNGQVKIIFVNARLNGQCLNSVVQLS